MELDIKPGKYIVAVSGGVDSMVLLDVLSRQPQLELIVAHLDHGIRADSSDDRHFVEQTAKTYGLDCTSKEVQLGPDTSEDTARKARYMFLEHVRKHTGSSAIITAHHQDDVLETMCINLIRGTGRQGLSSLCSTQEMLRPLLDISKTTILKYAQEHHISWREDSTNADDRYLRNHLRHHTMPQLTPGQRQKLVDIYAAMVQLNPEINQAVSQLLPQLIYEEGISRSQFIQLPHAIAREVMIMWLRSEHDIRVDRRQIERLVTAVKTARLGTSYDIDKRTIMNISRKFAKVTPRSARKTSV